MNGITSTRTVVGQIGERFYGGARVWKPKESYIGRHADLEDQRIEFSWPGGLRFSHPRCDRPRPNTSDEVIHIASRHSVHILVSGCLTKVWFDSHRVTVCDKADGLPWGNPGMEDAVIFKISSIYT